MVVNFKFKEYCTKYFAGSTFHKYVCFSPGCSDGIYGNNAFVTYYIPKKVQELSYCFLDKDEILLYIIELQKIFGLTLLSFKENKRYYLIQIEMPYDKRYFLYVSTYIRYLYEFPFSLLLKCAVQNRVNFPKFNITHIIQFYIALFYKGRTCHCPGMNTYAFRNINSKSQYNLIRNWFNNTHTFVRIQTKHITLTESFEVFNDKILPHIIISINNIANRYFERYEKSLCCWGR